MSAKNSISQLLEQFLELNTNSLEIFNRINEAISTDKKTVTIDLYDPTNDGVKSVQIPAFGYLKREIERLDTNLSSISDVENNGSTVRLKDGTYRKLFTSKLKGPSKSITSLAAPTEFNTKLNEFFEDFLNPLLTIKLDVSGQIPVETERVYIERYIFDSQDPVSTDQFDEVYKGSNELTKEGLESDIAENGLKYHLDAEVIEMPIRTIQYSGKFDVTKITNEQKSQVVDGVTQTKTIKLFTLDKLSYSDASKSLKETEVLKVSDSLIVNSGEYRTRYIIKSIDNSTSQVELELIEGYEAIKIGSQALTVYRDIDTDLDVEINVGFDERQVIFIKPVDPISNITADDYSPGIAFYSNELKIDGVEGTKQTLSEYYKTEVSDFGQFIKALSVDYIPPSSVGIMPIAPILDPADLKVVQINKHLTDNTTTKKIKQLKSDKLASEQSLKNLDEAIKQKKTLLNTKKFNSKVERDNQRNEYSALVNDRESEAKLYASIVSEIKAAAESSDLAAVTPKFRVRGFYPIPEPRKIGDEISQEVVQFKIRYRYVSTSGKTSQVDQMSFKDTTNNSSKTAAFSNWVEVNGPVRKREKQTATSKYAWITESEEDAQAVNFNSLDLPISSGEIIEIMVKSISEAGYPANPLTSDWSSIVKVEFPEGELSTDSLSGLVNSNELDALKVSINSDLETAGVFQHIEDSFLVNDQYYVHNANKVASGFLTQEQSPISVYDKLLELTNEIERLRAQIDGTIGELLVQIIDEEGNVTPVTNNQTIKLFAGYYVNELPETNYKGHIVTKNFKINLSNTKASELELIARIIGDTELPAYSSSTSQVFGLKSGTIDPLYSNNDYYTNEAKYDLVPVVYQNLESDNLLKDYLHNSPDQSSQLRGQFAYSRFKNIANDKGLYISEVDGNAPTPNGDIDQADQSGYDRYEYGISNAYGITGVTETADGSKNFSAATFSARTPEDMATDFIWNGGRYNLDPVFNESGLISTDTIGTSLYDNSILIHGDHPLAVGGSSALEIQANGLVGLPKTTPLRATDLFGKQQTPFKILQSVNDTGTFGVRKSLRNSFDPNDKYLLGGHSCGSFLFLSPLDSESLIVDAKNKSGKKSIPGNSAKSITLDLVFQYRMTDYYGVTSDTGIDNSTGRIGGVLGNIFSNLTYSKKIGVDILDSNNQDFKFDIEVYAKYRTTGKNINSITASMLTNYNNSGGKSLGSNTDYFGGAGLDFSQPTLISTEYY